MDEGRIGREACAAQRLRSAVIMTDYQMERVARDVARENRSHALLTGFPELQDMLPWVKKAA